jgi:hypothetical protein
MNQEARNTVDAATHSAKCTAGNGWIDGRDYVWVEDHEGPLPHPAQDGDAVARRDPVLSLG